MEEHLSIKWDCPHRMKYGDPGTGRNMNLLREWLAATNWLGKNNKIIKLYT
jgi:hypothetical protein